jgi:flavin-dependent dehydrogenase
MDAKIIKFLESIVHGPAGSISLSEYEKWLRKEAEKLLVDMKKNQQA